MRFFLYIYQRFIFSLPLHNASSLPQVIYQLLDYGCYSTPLPRLLGTRMISLNVIIFVLTAFSTNCGRAPRMIFMDWKTSIACSIFIRSRRFEMAMYVPVRPAPSLKFNWKKGRIGLGFYLYEKIFQSCMRCCGCADKKWNSFPKNCQQVNEINITCKLQWLVHDHKTFLNSRPMTSAWWRHLHQMVHDGPAILCSEKC